ncbi:MAG TPA: hypothetical protein VH394_28215 [Thermoanaerobaculia bacterium]|jgi:hypothetical protein|nr:hypothetical protein [Thermoanaerobaculia bacterium]
MPSFHAFFRELFQTFLDDFIRIAEPDFMAHLLPGLARFPVLDLGGWSDEERAALGAVAEMPTRDGRWATVLIHTEPEPLSPAETSRRLSRYFLALEAKYVQPVVLTTVWLRGGRPGINLESVSVNPLLDVEMVRIFYTTFGLGEARAEHYLERPEPLSWALAALMRPTRCGPAAHRRACLRRIAEAGLPVRETALLRACAEEWVAEPGDVFSVDRTEPGLPGGALSAVQGSSGKRRSER